MLLLLLLLTPPIRAADPGVEWARVVQEQIPAWRARRDSALARAEAAAAYFEGQRALAEAFPGLDGAPLDSPAWLSGRLDQLDAVGAARAAERYAVLPELQGGWQEAQRRRELEAALDAEDRADGLERRLILGLRQLIEDHPELRREALEPILEPLRARVAAADALGDEAGAEALAAARADALGAGEELQRFDALIAGIRRAATTSAPAPDYRPDLGRLRDPADGPLALRRLELLRPFLGPADGAVLDRALADFIDGEGLPQLREALAAARAELEQLGSASAGEEQASTEALEAAAATRSQPVESARQRAAAAASATGELGALRRQQAALQLELAQVQLAIAQMKLTRALDSSRRALEAAEETRAEAAAARRDADSQSGLRGELLEILAAAQTRTAERTEVREAEATARKQQLDGSEDALRELAEDIETARALIGTLEASERRAGLDRAYRELRRELSALRREAGEADEALRRASEAAAALPGIQAAERARIREILEILGDDAPEGARSPEDIAAAWDEERERQEELAAADVTDARAYRDAIVHLLQRARLMRRDLRGEVSLDVLDEDRARLAEDVRQELGLLGPSLATALRDRLEWVRLLPQRIFQLGWLYSALLGSAWILVVALIWSYARRRSAAGVRWVLDRWAERVGTPYRRAELQAVEAPAVPVAVALIDLGLGYAFYEPVRETFAELGLLLLIYLQIATYRLLMNLFDLLVARHPSLRPALLTLNDEPRSHGRRTVRVLALWSIASQFTSYIALEILDTDALNDLAAIFFRWGFVLIATWLLYLWEPDIRVALSRRTSESRLNRFLSEPPRYAIERAPRALVGGTLLLGRALFNLVDLRATDRSGLGWLLNYINRRRLSGGEEDRFGPPAPSQLRRLLTGDACPDEWFVHRSRADELFSEALTAWMRERRAGRIVLIGDRGDGKGCWLDRRCAGLEPVGWTVCRHRVERRLISEGDMVGWLGTRLALAGYGGAPPGDVDALIEVLMELPGRIWVIQGLERTFLRAVGGFQAIRTLFRVVQQCSEHHFWVLGVHRPAWHYLSRLSALFDTHFFREEIDLEPLREGQLRELIARRMSGSGFEVDFSRLERPGLAGGDPEAERDRAERTYFRLLSEASRGNAAVALRYWADCLTLGEREGEVAVQLPGLSRELTGLSDVDLFVLTAVRVQEELTEPELSRVLNLAPAVTRAAVRSLADRDLLESRPGGNVGIPIRQLPGVTRLLRRRHFLQGAA